MNDCRMNTEDLEKLQKKLHILSSFYDQILQGKKRVLIKQAVDAFETYFHLKGFVVRRNNQYSLATLNRHCAVLNLPSIEDNFDGHLTLMRLSFEEIIEGIYVIPVTECSTYRFSISNESMGDKADLPIEGQVEQIRKQINEINTRIKKLSQIRFCYGVLEKDKYDKSSANFKYPQFRSFYRLLESILDKRIFVSEK